MDISLEDFNALSAERSSRDVKIARLEMQLASEQTNHEREMNNLMTEVEFLRNEAAELRKKLDMMMVDFENLRFENHWMKQYILLSVERVRDFFSHIRDFTLLAAIRSFVLDMLPPNATPEQRAFTQDVMRLQMPDESPQIVIENAVDVIATGGVKNVNSLNHD